MKRRLINIQNQSPLKKFCDSTPNKEVMLQTKKNAMSLSGHKIVYQHDEDSENTLILRSFHPDSSDGLRKYGIRGRKEIHALFLGILQLLYTTSKGKLKEKACFLTPTQINELYDLAEEMSS